MSSVHSQPINTISYTDYQHINQTFKPRYVHLHDQSKNSNTIDNPPNKLPFNLFLSATQYNKMLITNGKNRKRKTPQIIDGLITSLQYVNDPIFQKQISKRQKARQSIKTVKIQPPSTKNQNHNKHKMFTCHPNCSLCKHKGSHLCQSEVKKGKTLDYETIVPKKRKYSVNNKSKHAKSKFIAQQSRKARSSNDKSRKNKSSLNEQSLMNKSQLKRNPDISHLVIKSLIQFTQQKKAQQMYKASLERTKNAKQEYLKLLNEKIRSYNLQNSRRSGGKSRSKQKSLTKNEISLHYWQKIKNEVLQSLKNDNYSYPLKAQLQNYNFNVYDHKQIPKRQRRLSKEDIQYLRQVRQSQAKQTIQMKERQKKQSIKRIKNNLKSLQKQRKKRISHNQKKPFQPTANMIRSAFQNVIQTNEITKKQVQNRNLTSIFKNEGIRANKNKNLGVKK